MNGTTIIFIHGFASSSRSTKAKYLHDQGQDLPGVDFHAIDLNPTPTDFRYLTTTGAINRLRQYVVDREIETVQLMGSSFGGLVAMYYAHRYGNVGKILLLAPLLRWRLDWLSEEEIEIWRKRGTVRVPHYGFGGKIPLEFGFYVDGQQYQEGVPPAKPVRIIHGREDNVVPVGTSRRYAVKHPEQVELFEVEAGHVLNDHLDMIWEHVQGFLLEG
ncbi:MAG: esterase [Anaerolineae bacterium]|nr:esterase [Anaerolineae bacterium]